jgi:hypothetical protein
MFDFFKGTPRSAILALTLFLSWKNAHLYTNYLKVLINFLCEYLAFVPFPIILISKTMDHPTSTTTNDLGGFSRSQVTLKAKVGGGLCRCLSNIRASFSAVLPQLRWAAGKITVF